jgi:hypothetical protein
MGAPGHSLKTRFSLKTIIASALLAEEETKCLYKEVMSPSHLGSCLCEIQNVRQIEKEK